MPIDSVARGLAANALQGASTGGSSTQIQYNFGGTFGGAVGLTWNGSALTFPAGAVGTPSINFGDATTGFYRSAANVLNASISGVKAMSIGQANVNNTAVGYGAFGAALSGTHNQAFGYVALASVTSGGSNVAVGSAAMQNVTTATLNVGVGFSAAKAVTGAGSTAVGANALVAAAGGGCTAIGYLALTAYTGTNATAVGSNALKSLTSGANNIGIGVLAGQALTTGHENIAIGNFALWTSTDATNCIAIGYNALGVMGTGVQYGGNQIAIGTSTLAACTTGSENVGVGGQACGGLTTGYQNVCVGVQSGQLFTTAFYNAALGTSSLGGITTGSANVAVGQSSAYQSEGGAATNALTTGDHCTFLGAFTLPFGTTQHTHVTVIGANATAAADVDNCITIGRTADTVYVPGPTILQSPATLAKYTVVGLPSGTEGQVAFATNGRKVGEGAGVGTGVPVYFSNAAWRVFSTDAAVAA